MVRRQQNLIKTAQQAHYWSSCTDGALDKLADKLAPLMKFREQLNPGEGQVTLDLQDELHKKETVHFGPKNEAVSVSRYREMIEQLVLALTKNNPILQKLKQGQDISPDEAEQLARLLHDEHPHITEDLLQQTYPIKTARRTSYSLFATFWVLKRWPASPTQSVRRLTGLLPSTATSNSRQLEFLRLLKDFLIERETVEKRDLIQSPFTVLHPQGIRGVFTPAEIDEILSLTGKLAA